MTEDNASTLLGVISNLRELARHEGMTPKRMEQRGTTIMYLTGTIDGASACARVEQVTWWVRHDPDNPNAECDARLLRYILGLESHGSTLKERRLAFITHSHKEFPGLTLYTLRQWEEKSIRLLASMLMPTYGEILITRKRLPETEDSPITALTALREAITEQTEVLREINATLKRFGR